MERRKERGWEGEGRRKKEVEIRERGKEGKRKGGREGVVGEHLCWNVYHDIGFMVIRNGMLVQ